ncbi:MAG: hypothetical protein QOI81_165 [Actinomycetota bacterium]|nr:hypothetical protein [Actinomycetota bacterium]
MSVKVNKKGDIMRTNTTARDHDRRVSELSREECLRLLADAGVGRVAFNTASGPLIHPVNYVVDNDMIVIRTSPHAILGEHAVGPMAFEVDELDATRGVGWSVLVVGTSAPVDDTEESIRLRGSQRLEPWAPGQRNLFLRITPSEITGRRLSCAL